MTDTFLLGQILAGVLILVTLLVFGHVQVREANERFIANGLAVPGAKRWWRDACTDAMRDDPRILTWMLSGVKLVVVGLALDLLGLGSPAHGFFQTALVTLGLGLLTVGLVALIAQCRMLQLQLRRQRSGSGEV